MKVVRCITYLPSSPYPDVRNPHNSKTRPEVQVSKTLNPKPGLGGRDYTGQQLEWVHLMKQTSLDRRASVASWVLVEEFNLSYHNKETILCTIDPYYGNLY